MSSNSNHARRNADHSDSADYDAVDDYLASYDGPYEELAQELRGTGATVPSTDDCSELDASHSETDDESVSSVIRYSGDSNTTAAIASDHLSCEESVETEPAKEADFEAENAAIDRRCPICDFDYYELDENGYSTIPVTTACGHRLCLRCLHRIAHSHNPTCPFDRLTLGQTYPPRGRARSEPVRSTRLMVRDQVRDPSVRASVAANDVSPPRLELLPRDEEWARTVAWAEEQDRLSRTHISLMAMNRSDQLDELIRRARRINEAYEHIWHRLRDVRTAVDLPSGITVRDFAIRDGNTSRQNRLHIEWVGPRTRRIMQFGEIEVRLPQLREANASSTAYRSPFLNARHRMWGPRIHRDVFVEHAEPRTRRHVGDENPAGPSNTPAAQSPSLAPSARQPDGPENAERVIELNELERRREDMNLQEMSPSEKDEDDDFDDESGDDCDCSMD